MLKQIVFVQMSLYLLMVGPVCADWLRSFPLPLTDGRYVDLDAEGRFLFVDYIAEHAVVLADIDPEKARAIIGGGGGARDAGSIPSAKIPRCCGKDCEKNLVSQCGQDVCE